MPILLTDALVTKATGKRRKLFDSRCQDFYADISPAGVASFRLKVWNAAKQTQESVGLGKFNPETFTVEHARTAAWKLKGQGGDIVARAKDTQAAIIVAGITFDQVADEFTADCETRLKRPRDIVTFLKPARAAFGRRAISAVKAGDIANLLKTFTSRGKLGMARQVRVTLYSLFAFAAEAGREYVTANPCSILPKQAKAKAKDRFLTDEEIRVLWWGLDRPDLPAPRHIALGLKLILATALRPGEVLSARRSEIGNISKQRGGDGGIAYAIPPERTKKNRLHVQPLNSLAQEIVAECVAMEGQGGLLLASGRQGGEPTVQSLSAFLNGKVQVTRGGKKYRQPGILAHLGFTAAKGQPFAPFTAHDLRRTGVTQLGLHDISPVDTGRILDHDIIEPGEAAATKVYDVSKQAQKTKRRRPTLDRLDVILRDIIGPAPATNVVKLIREAA